MWIVSITMHSLNSHQASRQSLWFKKSAHMFNVHNGGYLGSSSPDLIDQGCKLGTPLAPGVWRVSVDQRICRIVGSFVQMIRVNMLAKKGNKNSHRLGAAINFSKFTAHVFFYLIETLSMSTNYISTETNELLRNCMWPAGVNPRLLLPQGIRGSAYQDIRYATAMQPARQVGAPRLALYPTIPWTIIPTALWSLFNFDRLLHMQKTTFVGEIYFTTIYARVKSSDDL